MRSFALRMAVVVIAVFGGISALAQTNPNLESGFHDFGSYHVGNVDAVNLVNGGVSFKIPIISYPQRGGVPAVEHFFQDTGKKWGLALMQVPAGSGLGYNTVFPWMGAGAPLSGGINNSLNLIIGRTRTVTTNPNLPLVESDFNYWVATPDGSVHNLDGQRSNGTANGAFLSVDTSGFQFTLTSGTRPDHQDDSGELVDRNGTHYFYRRLGVLAGNSSSTPIFLQGYQFTNYQGDVTQVTTYNDVASPISIVDANGNTLSLGIGPAPGPDTLGRSVVGAPEIFTQAQTSDYSGCNSARPITKAAVISFPGIYGGSYSVKLCYASVNISTAFSQPANALQYPNSFSSGPWILVVSIVLPDNSSWSMDYDAYGNITSLTYPTGGRVSYQWQEIALPFCEDGHNTPVSRAVQSRTLFDGTNSNTWQYSWGTRQSDGTITNIVTDPTGNDTAHVMSPVGPPCGFYETETRSYQGSHTGGALLKTVDTVYSGGEGNLNVIPANVVPITVTTTLANGKVNQVTRQYDPGISGTSQEPSGVTTFGNVTLETATDWGQGAPGPVLRQTATTYQWQGDSTGNYLNAGLLDLQSSVIVKDANGNRTAETDSIYDESAYLTSSGITTQHGAPPGLVRGNLTTVKKWLNTNNSWITGHTNWYDTGEVYQGIDPLGHTTTHSYDPYYVGAYSTKTCNTLNQCVSGTYDFNTGLLTSFTNANATTQASGNTQGDAAHTSNYSYESMFRLTLAQLPPDSSGHRPQTSFTYSPPNVFPLNIQRTRTISAALNDVATNYFDGLGRVYRAQHNTPDGNALVDTTYDGLGRVVQVTNPYYSTSDPTYGVIQTQYDALGRPTSTIKQDGSVSMAQYSGNCVTTVDEARNPRQTCSDALGRLTQVEEPSATDNSVFNPITQWGMPGDIPVPGDYDGDGKTDFAIWRPSTGQWWIFRSSDEVVVTKQWGVAGDIPVPGDYDGDGKTDIAIWRPSTGTWWIVRSSDGTTVTQTWGVSGDIPVSGDYDGDGKTDYAIWRPSTGVWWILRSSDGGTTSEAWGHNGDTPVPGDYDGDKKTDLAVWSSGSGTWWVQRSSDGATVTQVWGQSGDTPAPADYDGDKKTDYAVFRPSTTTWWVIRSSDGQQVQSNTGTDGVPVAGNYRGDGKTDFAVWQPGGAWNVSLAYNTQYSYDALGNLLNVTQQGDPRVSTSSQWRLRNFTYNSLSQLLTATNPESGTISYSYDADANLLQKTSPAPNQTGTATQTISYCYDSLNRVTGKAYSSQSCPLSTPVATYSYDAGTNAIGHLTSLVDQAGSASYSYDPLGRIAGESRTIAGIQKNLAYTYNLDDSVATLTYPSGAVVAYTPDAAGRMLSAVDAGNSINYVTGAAYSPDGQLTGFLSGHSGSFAGIANNFSYNNRLQPIAMTAATSSAAILSLGYDFHLGNGDNGNVYGITNYRDTSRNQTFAYDPLNRLISAQNAGIDCTQTSLNGKTKYWGNSYGYDPWGNLLQKIPTKCSAENLSVTALSNNQLSGYGYDAAGNMIHDATTGNNYSFDAENRITGAAGFTYVYDAGGNRVEKSNGTTGTIYWSMTPGIVAESDLNGNLQSEYIFFDGERVARKDFSGSTASVAYYFSDHLKTASVITNAAGVITEDEDYYPWGGELQFANSDPNHYKFTGTERDAETGLDYFGARFYAGTLGRFLTSDPLMVSGTRMLNPQLLNLYAYVGNNPTNFLDPTGRERMPQAYFEALRDLHKEAQDDANREIQAYRNGQRGGFGNEVLVKTAANLQEKYEAAQEAGPQMLVSVLRWSAEEAVMALANWDEANTTFLNVMTKIANWAFKANKDELEDEEKLLRDLENTDPQGFGLPCENAFCKAVNDFTSNNFTALARSNALDIIHRQLQNLHFPPTFGKIGGAMEGRYDPEAGASKGNNKTQTDQNGRPILTPRDNKVKTDDH